MALTYSKTLTYLRRSVGRNLGKMVTGTTTATGTNTTARDTKLFGGDDEYIGSYIHLTDGTYNGTTHRITDYTASTGTMTFAQMGGTVASSTPYELWENGFDPDVVDEFIDQAVLELAGRAYDPIENLDLHTDGINTRWEIPSNIEMIQDVYYRDKFTFKELHNCGVVFDETTEGNAPSVVMTQSIDTEDYKRGGSSLRLDIATGLAANDFITDSITSVNISKYDYLEFWIKSTVNTNDADLNIHLDNGTVTGDGNDKEALNVPALTADTWKYCRLALQKPEEDTAIVSIGFKMEVDKGAFVVHLDDIKVVKNDTAVWEKLPRDTWRIDKEGTVQGASTADLVLSDRGRALASYRMIKLVGGDKPALFSGTDATTTEVMERFVIAYATALTAQAGSTRAELDTDGMRTLAGFWHNKAAEARNSLPFLTNVRQVR